MPINLHIHKQTEGYRLNNTTKSQTHVLSESSQAQKAMCRKSPKTSENGAPKCQEAEQTLLRAGLGEKPDRGARGHLLG